MKVVYLVHVILYGTSAFSAIDTVTVFSTKTGHRAFNAKKRHSVLRQGIQCIMDTANLKT